MNKKLIVGTAIAVVFAAALIASGVFVTGAYAQGPTQNPNAFYGAMHNNQALLALLKISQSDLAAQRQAGKSLLDIATAKGVSEKQLLDVLVQPIAGMHGSLRVAQNYPQSGAEQMTQYMHDWIAKDIRVAQYGTMTDFRLLGMGPAMMNGFNGANGFSGMTLAPHPFGSVGVGGFNGANGTNGFGGMMGGWWR